MATNSKSHLLALPAELRNRIYELAVTSSHTIDARNRLASAAAAQPPFTRTCRQVRQECLPVFYGCNTFRFDACDFPGRVTPGPLDAQIKYVKHLRITMKHCSHGNAYELDLSKGLKSSSIAMGMSEGGHVPHRKNAARTCSYVNPARLAIGTEWLETLHDGEDAVLGRKELAELCLPLWI